MDTVYLHIGVFKTASSSLQVFFAKNADLLRSRGVTYPEAPAMADAQRGMITSGNGAELAKALLPKSEPARRSAQLKWFEQVLSDATTPTVLLSSELFTNMGADAFEALADIAEKANRRLKIICFVREQSSYLESIYIQHVKRRRITTHPDSYIRALYPTVPHLRYGTFLHALSKIVGAENLTVREYGKGKIIKSVLDILGLDPEGLNKPPKKINVSLPYYLVPIFLELNKMDPNMSFSDQVVRNQAQLQLHGKAEKFSLVSPDLRAEVQHHFREENDQLAQQFFDGAPIFDTPAPPYISLQEARDKLDLTDITKMLGGLAIQHERRLVRIENALLALGKEAGFEPDWVRKIRTD